MGVISKKLASRFRMAKVRTQAGDVFTPPKDVRSIRQCLKEGHDPVHSVYISLQNFTSYFAESVASFPEFRLFRDKYLAAEDKYMPSGPPMSPLTTSFFTLWGMYDLRFGPNSESIGSCLLDVSGVIDMAPDMVEALRGLAASRMGIYEHGGMEGSKCRLKELLTGREFVCHSTSGYQGKEGELWYVRLCPPVVQLADYHIVITTPYILVGTSKQDWTAWLNKSLMSRPMGRTPDGLHQLLKHGDKEIDWSEFVFQAYHHHQPDAIFLAGLPDVEGSRPHAK